MTGPAASAIARLTQLLGLSRGVDRPSAELHERLARTRAASVAWKKKAHETATHGRLLRERLTRMAAALRQVRARLIAAQRDRPSMAVVEGVFAHRVTTLAARIAARSVPDREARLVEASEAYRHAIAGPTNVAAIAGCKTAQGLTWWVPAPAASHVSAERFRLPFRGIAQTRELTRGGIMLDIGANIGRMAIPRVVLGDVLVAYCAEPDPSTYACLVANVVENGLRGLVLPDQTAIGDCDGTVSLLRSGSSENFRVVGGHDHSAATVDVPCCRLDTWVRRLNIDLDAVTFIKVDVEGFERRLVAGAPDVLSHRHIAWQMEIKPLGLRAAGDEPADLYGDLQRHFTHFLDLNRRAIGPLVRPTEELAPALQYLEPRYKTDILLFSTPQRLT